jgi:hypothetical protein
MRHQLQDWWTKRETFSCCYASFRISLRSSTTRRSDLKSTSIMGVDWIRRTGYRLLLWGGIVQSVPCNCDHFCIALPILSSNNFRFINQSSLYRKQQRRLAARRGETGRGMAAECCLRSISSYLQWYLTCRKIIRHGVDGFTSPPKELVLRIFIAIINTSLSAGFEPANLESNTKHDNHLPLRTTE